MSLTTRDVKVYGRLWNKPRRPVEGTMYVCMYVCMFVCLYVHTQQLWNKPHTPVEGTRAPCFSCNVCFPKQESCVTKKMLCLGDAESLVCACMLAYAATGADFIYPCLCLLTNSDNIFIFTCTCMHTCIHTYMHTYIADTYSHTHTCIHTQMHAYIHTYIHTYRDEITTRSLNLGMNTSYSSIVNILAHARVHARVHMYMAHNYMRIDVQQTITLVWK